MKKYLLLLLLFGCSLIADTVTYDATWTPNTETDMSHYNLYVWQGADTLVCPLFDNMPINPSDPLFYSALTFTPSLNIAPFVVEANGEYIAIVLQAVNTNNIMSLGAFAGFVKTDNANPPAKPINVQIN